MKLEIFINIVLAILILLGVYMAIRYPKDIFLRTPKLLFEALTYKLRSLLYFMFVFPFHLLSMVIDSIWKTKISKATIWKKLDPDS